MRVGDSKAKWAPVLLAAGFVAACNGSISSSGDNGDIFGEGDGGVTGEPPEYGLEGDECTFHGDCEAPGVCEDGYCVESTPISYCATTPALVTTALPEAMDADVSGLLAADIDGDGNADLISGRNPPEKGIQILLGPGDGTPENIGADGDRITPLQLGDFDQDGNLDLLAGSGDGASVFPGDGSGSFGAGVLTPVEGSISGRVALDVDGDGRADVATTAGKAAQLWLGDGAAGFSWHSSQGGFEEDLNIALLGDVLGGGQAELIHIDPLARLRAVDVAADESHIIEPAGSGHFENHYLESLHIGADPRPDLVRSFTRHSSTTIVTMWLRTDSGLTPPRYYSLPAELTPEGAGDIDGVNGPDLVLTGGNTLYILFNVNSDEARCLVEYDSEFDWITTAVADFDGDARDEIIWSDQTDFVLSELP